MHQRINEHEMFQIHKECSSTLLSIQSNLNVASLVKKNFINQKNAEVAKNREVMKRIIDIIKFIGNSYFDFHCSLVCKSC